MHERAFLAILLFALYMGMPHAAFSESSVSLPSCRVFSEFPLAYPGSSVDITVQYSGFTFPSPIAVVCRPNSVRFCFVGPGFGECKVACDYPYKGVYTVTATSLASSCQPFLVVADPQAKPVCSLTPSISKGNGTINVQLSARFSNLLPTVTEAAIACGNGAPAVNSPLIGKLAQATCQYSAEGRKEVYTPLATSGGARCTSIISVYPISDLVPPRVSFYNLTYRFAAKGVYNISINASDNVEVDRVELYINYSLVSTMRSEPYYYIFDPRRYENGSEFILEARAFDIYGNTNVTQPYLITKAVEGSRSCNITATPIYSPIPAAITLTAKFYNTSSDVLYAYFKPHYTQNTLNTSGPQTPILNGIARTTLGYNAPNIYTPYVTDGNISCTTIVYITATPDTTAPTVTLTSPANNKNIRIGDTIELAATASDNVVVVSVEYYLDDRLIANSTSVPFNATWNTSGERIGFYYVKAIAYDGAGNPSLFPSKSLVILSTNRTCSISPSSAVVLPKKPINFSVSCFNFTTSNFSQPITNRTISNNITENFTIENQEMISTMLTHISCPEMKWSSSLFWSDISPRNSPFSITFTPQDTTADLPGVLTATDSASGFSCSARVLIVKDLPGCSLSFDSPVLVGAKVSVTIKYENITREQEFRIACRPNLMVMCTATAGSGSCTGFCDYPSLGRFFVSASSPSISCASKRLSVLPHPDVFPPVVSITRPFNRQIINGVFKFEAYATDNFGVSRVDFLVDSEIASSSESSPYEFYMNTTKVRNGDHIVAARAFDETGNSMDYSVTVTVAN
ncbi:MAG: Ig-like domain-containing protein [Candidatus Micrarchaeota archaeon]